MMVLIYVLVIGCLVDTLIYVLVMGCLADDVVMECLDGGSD